LTFMSSVIAMTALRTISTRIGSVVCLRMLMRVLPRLR
jgi:hypothetical protein